MSNLLQVRETKWQNWDLNPGHLGPRGAQCVKKGTALRDILRFLEGVGLAGCPEPPGHLSKA